mmetsp:Transcript_55555/g.136144  ORF Transcript_55555/g.136144 Transcript_55555/m.136144 type:complete len:299 (+) Transcript_55555:190-1086(+)
MRRPPPAWSMSPSKPLADPTGHAPARQSLEEPHWWEEGGRTNPSFDSFSAAGSSRVPSSIEARIHALSMQHAASQAHAQAEKLSTLAARTPSGSGPLARTLTHSRESTGSVSADLAVRDLSTRVLGFVQELAQAMEALSGDLSSVFADGADRAKSFDVRRSEQARAEAVGRTEALEGELGQSRRTVEALRVRVAELERAAEDAERARAEEAQEGVALRMQVERLCIETEVQARHISSLRAAEGREAAGRSRQHGSGAMSRTHGSITESVRYVRPGASGSFAHDRSQLGGVERRAGGGT